MKKIYLSIVGFIVLALGLLIADYFALFGTRYETSLEMVETILKPVNKRTGELILEEIRIRCIQKGIENACTTKPSKYLGQIRMNVPLMRLSKKTYLFTKEEGTIKNTDPNLHIMLIPRNFQKESVTIPFEDVLNLAGKEYHIELEPIDWGNAGAIENE